MDKHTEYRDDRNITTIIPQIDEYWVHRDEGYTIKILLVDTEKYDDGDTVIHILYEVCIEGEQNQWIEYTLFIENFVKKQL